MQKEYIEYRTKNSEMTRCAALRMKLRENQENDYVLLCFYLKYIRRVTQIRILFENRCYLRPSFFSSSPRVFRFHMNNAQNAHAEAKDLLVCSVLLISFTNACPRIFLPTWRKNVRFGDRKLRYAFRTIIIIVLLLSSFVVFMD